MGLFLPACIAGSSDVDARRALRARAFLRLGFAVLRSMARSIDDRTSFKFPPPNRDQPRQIYRRAVGPSARSTRPVDAAPTNSLSWLGRSCSAFHRVARHGLYNCSRGGSPMLKSVL